MIRPILFILSAALVLAAPVPARAQAEPADIGVFKDWRAFTKTQSGAKVCYVGAVPKKSEGKYSKRDETYVVITHRPSQKIKNEVSVRAGYIYKEKSSVTVSIGGGSFRLWTQGEHAWAQDADDPKLVSAMRGGAKMIVKGVSSRGTRTTDTYSLSGFTAAYNAASKACGL